MISNIIRSIREALAPPEADQRPVSAHAALSRRYDPRRDHRPDQQQSCRHLYL